MLEFGSEVALEIVLDDEDAEEVGVAAGTQDIPGEGGQAERGDGGGMKETEGVAPALREKRPGKNGASGKNDGGGSFCEDREAKEETEQKERRPRGLRNDRRILIAREAEHDCGADHRDREHRAERHVSSGGVREADHADSCGQQKQQPAGGFRAVKTKSQPGHRERGEQGGDGARQSGGSFADAEKPEAKRSAPVEERWLLKPGFSVQARSDPVSGLSHVACDPRVARLVRADEADGAKMAEVADVYRRRDENGPANSGGGAGAGLFGDGSGSFDHGKVSLASNHYLPATDLLHTVARRQTRVSSDTQ